jgi:cell division protein FtsB
MLEFQDKKKFRRILYSKITFIIVLFFCLIIGRATFDMYKTNRLTAEKRMIAENELLDVKIRESSLRAQIGALKTERGVEEELRTKFRVVKNGEGVIIVVDDEAVLATTSESGLVSKFFEWVSGIF